MSGIEQQIRQAETRSPQWQFKKKTASEASSAWPFCHQGHDRFLIFADGGYWCRQCDTKGWLDEKDTKWDGLSATEKRLRLLEAEQSRARREREEMQRQITALEKMARCKDHLHYHQSLTMDSLEYWWSEGMSNESIDRYKLGFCSRCPTDFNGRPSYTIPVFGRDGETLVNIRHRLIDAPGGDKYRPHIAGLPNFLFNAHFTQHPGESIIITEGEKKSIVLAQEDLPNVAIMGKRSFNKEWIKWLEPFATVYVALDPDAQESARRLAALFSGRGRVVRLPCKVDDMIVRYGASRDDVLDFLRLGYPVDGNSRN